MQKRPETCDGYCGGAGRIGRVHGSAATASLLRQGTAASFTPSRHAHASHTESSVIVVNNGTKRAEGAETGGDVAAGVPCGGALRGAERISGTHRRIPQPNPLLCVIETNRECQTDAARTAAVTRGCLSVRRGERGNTRGHGPAQTQAATASSASLLQVRVPRGVCGGLPVVCRRKRRRPRGDDAPIGQSDNGRIQGKFAPNGGELFGVNLL